MPTITTSFIPPLTGYATLLPQLFLLLAAALALFADKLPFVGADVHIRPSANSTDKLPLVGADDHIRPRVGSADTIAPVGANSSAPLTPPDRFAAWAGTLCATLAALSFACFGKPAATVLFGARLVYTGDARFAAAAICVITALWCLWTAGSGKGRVREAVALALLSALGATLAVAALDIIVMLLAIELTSMPVYVLIGYRRQRTHGLEGALKYFLLSVMTSLIMIYGMSFLFGLVSSTHFTALAKLPQSPLTLIAAILALVGLFAKLSAAPFHWWAPDAYAGAQSWSLSYAATVPKIAGALVALRFVQLLTGANIALLPPVLLIAALSSMILGAFAALTQDDIRRLMAYSGVVNVGYLFILIAAQAQSGGKLGSTPLYFGAFFIVSYALPTLAILLISATEGTQLSDLSGLATRRPLTTLALAISALSLIGVPPLLGFFSKLNLFLAIMATKQPLLIVFVVLATLLTVVSAFFYLRLIKATLSPQPTVGADDHIRPNPNNGPQPTVGAVSSPPAGTKDDLLAPSSQKHLPLPGTIALAITTALILAAGLASAPLITWMTTL